MNRLVFEDDQAVVVAGDLVGEQVVGVDLALDQVAAATGALVILDQRLDVASLVGGHVPHLEIEEQRLVERDAVLFHGQFCARPFLAVRHVHSHVAAARQQERVAYRTGIREVMDAPAPAHGQRVQRIEANAVEQRRRLVEGLVHAPGDIVQGDIRFRVADLHMEMRAGRGSGVAHLPHHVALPHRELVRPEMQVDAETFVLILRLLHTPRHVVAEAEHVSVHRSRTVGMRDIHTVAVSPGTHGHAGDIAALDGMDVIAHPAADTPVHTAVEMVVPQLTIGT